jgi:hypothetical protein
MTIINNKFHKEQEKLSVNEFESNDTKTNDKNKSISTGIKRTIISSNFNNNRCALCFKLLKNWKGLKLSPYYDIDKLSEFKPGCRYKAKTENEKKGRQKESLDVLNDSDVLFNKKADLNLDENNNCLNEKTVLVNNNSCSSKGGENNVEIFKKNKNPVLSLQNGQIFDQKSIYEDADLSLNSKAKIGDLIRKTILCSDGNEISKDYKNGFPHEKNLSSSSLSFIEKKLTSNNLTFNSNKICKACYDHVILIDYHMSCVDNLRVLMQNKITKSFRVSNKTRNLKNFKFKLHRFKPKRCSQQNNLKLRNSFLSLINSDKELLYLNEKSSNVLNGANKFINLKAFQLEASKKLQSLKRKTSVSDESLNNAKLNSFNRITKNGKQELNIQHNNLNGYCSPTSSASLSPSSTLSASSMSSMSNGIEKNVRQNLIENETINKTNQLFLTNLLTTALSTALSPLNHHNINKNQIQVNLFKLVVALRFI